jgi:hypothetical protein
LLYVREEGCDPILKNQEKVKEQVIGVVFLSAKVSVTAIFKHLTSEFKTFYLCIISVLLAYLRIIIVGPGKV